MSCGADVHVHCIKSHKSAMSATRATVRMPCSTVRMQLLLDKGWGNLDRETKATDGSRPTHLQKRTPVLAMYKVRPGQARLCGVDFATSP